MKKAQVIATMLLSLAASPLSADETLFGSPHESGGFGALVVKAASFGNGADMMTGARAGWIVNHSLILGGGFYMLTSTSLAPAEAGRHYSGRELKLTAYYWGAEPEYIFWPQSLFHVSVSSLFGTGGFGYIDQHDNDFHITDGVYVLEPAVHGTLNVSTRFRVSAGVSYRLIADISLVGIDNADMSGLSGTITLRFGKF